MPIAVAEQQHMQASGAEHQRPAQGPGRALCVPVQGLCSFPTGVYQGACDTSPAHCRTGPSPPSPSDGGRRRSARRPSAPATGDAPPAMQGRRLRFPLPAAQQAPTCSPHAATGVTLASRQALLLTRLTAGRRVLCCCRCLPARVPAPRARARIWEAGSMAARSVAA